MSSILWILAGILFCASAYLYYFSKKKRRKPNEPDNEDTDD